MISRMTTTADFAARTRARIAEMRAVLTEFRDLGGAATKRLSKLAKQQAADSNRVYGRLGALSDDATSDLSDDASDAELERAYARGEQINEVAADVEEISLAGGAVEDLAAVVRDAVDDVFSGLREAEAQVSALERAAAKLGL